MGRNVLVIGHKNPDTDAICAAIAYADLKNRIDDTAQYIPKRAGNINSETRYVLEYFGVDEPELVNNVSAQIKDINYRRTKGVSSHISIKKAWEIMKELSVVSLPVVKQDGRLEGLVVTGDIATSYMDVVDNGILATARTQYKNIIETLHGSLVTGNEHGYFTKGKVVIAAETPELMKQHINPDDMVILNDRYETQMTAIEINAGCIIVCSNAAISDTVLNAAKARECVIISTPHDTFTVARLINQSMPIKYIMRKDELICFDPDDYVDDVREEMSKVRHRDFPVVNEDGQYSGMISRRNLLNVDKKKVILVDHNEKPQAVEGIEEAEILEIIDHHRLGSLETVTPVFFRNQPLGSTCTIVYKMFEEKHVEIQPKIAGIMLAAILSDTLMFRSPTCTQVDMEAAQELAAIAGEDPITLASNMFKAGSNFNDKSIPEIFGQDFKKFHSGDITFGVSQVTSVNREILDEIRDGLNDYIRTVINEQRMSMVFVMLTNIIDQDTELLYFGEGAKDLIEVCYGTADADGRYILEGVVSRKKQLVPTLIAGIDMERNA